MGAAIHLILVFHSFPNEVEAFQNILKILDTDLVYFKLVLFLLTIVL